MKEIKANIVQITLSAPKTYLQLKVAHSARNKWLISMEWKVAKLMDVFLYISEQRIHMQSTQTPGTEYSKLKSKISEKTRKIVKKLEDLNKSWK